MASFIASGMVHALASGNAAISVALTRATLGLVVGLS